MAGLQIRAASRIKSSAMRKLFEGGGEVGALMRDTDWAATPLGPAEAWPQSLRTIVRIMLTSRFAMWLGWGPELTFLYNDAYAHMTLGAKHPWALGRPAREVWAEIWAQIGPRIDRCSDRRGDLGRGAAAVPGAERLSGGDVPHLLLQPGARRRGHVGGMLCVVTEETERVIGERRLAAARDAWRPAWRRRSDARRGLCRRVELTRRGPAVRPAVRADLPVRRDRRRGARRRRAPGIDATHPAAPPAVALDAAGRRIDLAVRARSRDGAGRRRRCAT